MGINEFRKENILHVYSQFQDCVCNSGSHFPISFIFFLLSFTTTFLLQSVSLGEVPSPGLSCDEYVNEAGWSRAALGSFCSLCVCYIDLQISFITRGFLVYYFHQKSNPK